eukprot:7409221-Alexandrium_andersonii.AAC.1
MPCERWGASPHRGLLCGEPRQKTPAQRRHLGGFAPLGGSEHGDLSADLAAQQPLSGEAPH